MKKVGLIFVGMLVLAIALGVGQSQAVVCDLTTSGATCTNPFGDGVNFEQITINPVGTGVFDPIVRIQPPGNETYEKGYNTDGTPEFDSKAGIWTHSITIGDLGTVNIGGIDYYRFDLDINEPNSAPDNLITLDVVEIWLHTVGNDDVYADGLGTKVYSFYNPNIVELDYNLEAGSGWGDMSMYVPVSTIGTDASKYLYLYSEFGDPNGVADGFEEWRALTGAPPPPPPPPPPVPEPSTLLLLGGGLMGLGALRRKFKK